MEKDSIVKGGCSHSAEEVLASAYIVTGCFLLCVVILIAAVIAS